MTPRRKRILTGVASLGFLLLLPFGPTPDASAQTGPVVTTDDGRTPEVRAQQIDPTVPPTVPCDGCGPSGTKNPGATQAWAYPNHHCLPDGSSAYSLTFGLGRNADRSASFYVRYADNANPGASSGFDKPLDILMPGQQRTIYPLVIVKPGQTVNIEVFAFSIPGGAPVQFGDSTSLREFTLTCPCEQPPTTVPPSSTPSTVPPPSSAPGTPTTTPPGGSSVPGTPTTSAFELPATGAGGSALFAGIVILALAAFCFIATRGLHDDLEDLGN